MAACFGAPKVLRTAQGQGRQGRGLAVAVPREVAGGAALLVVLEREVQAWRRGPAPQLLARGERGEESLAEDGRHVCARWCEARQTLVVLAERGVLFYYGLRDHAARGLEVYLKQAVDARPGAAAVVDFVCDGRTVLLLTAAGAVLKRSWQGEDRGALHPFPPTDADAGGGGGGDGPGGGFATLTYSKALGMLAAVTETGACGLLRAAADRSLKRVDFWRWVPLGGLEATHVAFNDLSNLLSVGTGGGSVLQFKLGGGEAELACVRRFSLEEWGQKDALGGVVGMDWSPDGRALAVIWESQSVHVWSLSGCKLMSLHDKAPTARRSRDARHSLSFEAARADADAAAGAGPGPGGGRHPCGLGSVCWSPDGNQLFASKVAHGGELLCFPFLSPLLHHTSRERRTAGEPGVNPISIMGPVLQVLVGSDRFLCVHGMDKQRKSEAPTLQQVIVPEAYLEDNWPIRHASLSDCGTLVAVAGTRGFAVYDARAQTWRLFGDVNQERGIQCRGMTWLGKAILIVNFTPARSSAREGAHELQIYDVDYLDRTSLLCTHPLVSKPDVMDCRGNHFLMLTQSQEMLRIDVLSFSRAPGGAALQVESRQELVIISAKTAPVLVSMALDGAYSDAGAPQAAVVLHADGELCLLDLDSGAEARIKRGIENFWLERIGSDWKYEGPAPAASAEPGQPAGGPQPPKPQELWIYGERGMHSIHLSNYGFKTPNGAAVAKEYSEVTDMGPELEFDSEVYPITVCEPLFSVIGIAQQFLKVDSTRRAMFQIQPKAQSILSALMRQQLRTDASLDNAVRLASSAQGHPHFAHSLEWLVFTLLNEDSARPDHEEAVLLERSIQVLQKFPEYLDVIVRVARKTDPSLWPTLIRYTGRPTSLFEEAMNNWSFKTASCFLVVVETIEGADIGQDCALRLLQKVLQVGHYHLTGELVRFLVRSARDMKYSPAHWEEAAQEDAQGGIFWYFFGYGATQTRKDPGQTREEVLKFAVHKLLSTHAAALLASKELTALASFMRNSGFDVIPLLASENQKLARLGSFGEAVAEVGEKLSMGNQQDLVNEADCELLLEAFREAGCTEWVVVLATLLDRAPLLLNLLLEDSALYSAYCAALAQMPQYKGLLNKIREGMYNADNA